MSTRVITALNVNDAYHEGLTWLRVAGKEQQSRNGRVIKAPGPVITEYVNPRNRVLWCPVRDANPVFHLFESLWMLAGAQSVHLLTPFNKRMVEYSDNRFTLNGAYGFRWRFHFGADQLIGAINMLRVDPSTRRCVIAMWDPRTDLNSHSRDIPCNTHIYLEVEDDKLNMTVCCRSNDAVWGAYGANAVHFSFLQEFVANAVGVEVGVYRQMSNNFHIYPDMPRFKEIWESNKVRVENHYDTGEAVAFPYLCRKNNWERFLTSCSALVFGDYDEIDEEFPFLTLVARPLVESYLMRRAGRDGWRERLTGTSSKVDWIKAYYEWVNRRSSNEG